MARLRVVNFNIKHAATADGYVGRPESLAAACAEIDADVLALQEVDRYVWRSGFTDLVTKAAGTTYTDSFFAPAMGTNLLAGINPGGQYGNALLVKGTISNQRIVPLTGDYIRWPYGRRPNIVPEPRNVMLAEVMTDSGLRLGAVNTHIGGVQRQRFIGAIAAEATDMAMPTVMMGDFNTMRPNMYKWLAAVSSLNLLPRPPQLTPQYKQSDHIAVEGFEVESVSAQWFNISDHPAIIAELQTADVLAP